VRCRKCRLLEIEHGADHAWAPVPTFGQIAENLAKGFSDCDFGGQNIRFDLQVLASEMKRVNVVWSYAGALIIDAQRLEQLGEPRSLSHLYEKHTGKKLEGAHGALADVAASAEVIHAQVQKYDTLPRDLSALHDLQWPGWVDTEGLFRYDADEVIRASFGKHRGVAIDKIPLTYWQWILEKSDFGTEIKDLAANAKLRKFPARRGV